MSRSGRIAERLSVGRTLSIEVFPPSGPDGRESLERVMDDLERLPLDFVSVTYGAGGTTRDRTVTTVDELSRRSFPVMPHLTCVGHSRDDVAGLLSRYSQIGVTNVLALAGDPPADGSDPGGDFRYASELVELLRATTDCSIGVAAHPEGHPRSSDIESDRRHLADKLEAADFGITQFFFDADAYFRMLDELERLGCDTPVLPGVMPLVTPVTVRRFAAMANASFPDDFAQSVIDAPDDERRLELVVDAAVDLCERLLQGGAPGLHIYCLNRSAATLAIVDRLGWAS